MLSLRLSPDDAISHSKPFELSQQRPLAHLESLFCFGY